MLKKITLTNYRSHEQTVVDLHPHVNVIVGRGQAGKTNIMRGFETLRLNRPAGFKYHSWFAGDAGTGIEVETDKGIVVAFTKDKDGAKYLIDWPTTKLNSRHEEYRKVGTKVPDQVTAALNMTDLNMQWQHDSPYLIAGSVGKIGKAINAVIDFEELDKWITDINSRRAKVNTEKAMVKAQLKANQEELAGLDGVQAAGDILAEAEMLETKIRGKYIRLEKLETLRVQGMGCKATLNRCDAALGAEEFVNRAEEIQTEVSYMADGLALLEEALTTNELMVRAERRKYMVKQKYIKRVKDLGMCPTCFGPADEATIARIREAL